MMINDQQKLTWHSPSHDVLAVTDERTYLLPHSTLREVISHYTLYIPRQHVRASPQPEVLHIVPDASGCIVCCLSAGNIEVTLWGPTSRVATVEYHPQTIALYLMVEFRPCGAGRLLNLPLALLHNETLPLETVDPLLSGGIVRLLEALCEHGLWHGLDTLLNGFDRLFLHRLEYTEASALSRHILDAVTHTEGTLRIEALSQQTGYSPRHLNRVMTEHVGMNIKRLARIIRINAACRHLAAAPATATDVAHQLGYHDQSHFIHDFNEICGITPGQYLLRMSDFYNEGLKLGATIPDC